jgi:TusA-related sulfurtransferase
MEELNLVGKECPEPFLKVAAKLMQMKEGTLKIMFNDPKCDEMILQAIELMDCKIIEHSKNGETFTLVLEKKLGENKMKKVNLTGC